MFGWIYAFSKLHLTPYSSTSNVFPIDIMHFYSVQFSSVAQLCPTHCDPMDCSIPGFPVLQHLPETLQTHVHWLQQNNFLQKGRVLLAAEANQDFRKELVLFIFAFAMETHRLSFLFIGRMLGSQNSVPKILWMI